MKRIERLLFCVCGCWLLLVGCQSSWREPFPDREIVYGKDLETVVFVHPDGSDPIEVKFDHWTGQTWYYLRHPLWSKSGKKIYFLTKWGVSLVGLGHPAYWEEGELLHECKDLGWVYQIEEMDEDTVFMLTKDQQIVLADLEQCEVIKTVLDFSELEQDPFSGVYGISYSVKEEALLYGLVLQKEDHIVRFDMKTGQSQVLGRGLAPAWSPDGQVIAYIRDDGVYVMNADGSGSRKLAEHGWFDELNPTRDERVLRWSPDGKWVLYHWLEDGSLVIYRIEIATGKQEVIGEGFYPDWRSGAQ